MYRDNPSVSLHIGRKLTAPFTQGSLGRSRARGFIDSLKCPVPYGTGHFTVNLISPVGLNVSFMALGGWSRVGAGHQTKHGENGHDGRSAVAEERQGQADNGHNADAHADVDHNLEHQCGSSAEAYQSAHVVLAADADDDAPGNDGQLQCHDQYAAQEAQLLTHGGEDVVRMLGKQVTTLGTVAVEQTLSRQTAAGQGLEVDLTVVTGANALCVEGGVDQDQDSFLLVRTQKWPDDGDRRGYTAYG